MEVAATSEAGHAVAFNPPTAEAPCTVVAVVAAVVVVAVVGSSMFPMSVSPTLLLTNFDQGNVDTHLTAPIQCRLAGSEGFVSPGWYVSPSD